MKRNGVKQLFSYIGDKRPKMYLSIVLAIIGELFGIVPYFSVAKIVTLVFIKNIDWNQTVLLVIIAIVSYLLKGLLTYKSSMLSHETTFEILKNIRTKITDKISKVPMGVIIETPIGEFKNLIVDKVSKLEDSMAHFMPELTSSIFAPICTLLLIFALDWRMGLISLITVPLSMLFFTGMMKDYKEKMETYMKASNEMNSNLVEYINGIQVIKAFNQTTSSFEKFSKSVEFYHDSTMSWWRQSWFWSAGAKAILPSTLLGTLPLGAYFYMNNEITISIYVMSLILPMGFIAPFIKLVSATEQFSLIKESLDQINEFMDTPVLKRPSKRVKLQGNSFEFNNVSFAYGKDYVLKNVNFKTMPRSMTAIVGPSGSGKSTIAKLMAGFWDANEGIVYYGGKNIKEISFDQLMENISYVAQDNFLFDKSIKENIKMGNSNASDDDIVKACKAAHCHEFILKLSKGYDTLAGDAGDKLSGGERQRITLARAILKDAPVIILDEATAYADPENEYLIQEGINQLVKGKTLIVVAHRLSTICKAEQILVISQGKVAERGKHDKLLKLHGIYSKLWDKHIRSIDVKAGEVI